MSIGDYYPEFFELVTGDGKRYLSYHCFTCNCKHLIRSTADEIKRIRASFRMVNKAWQEDEVLILHCDRKELPLIEHDGIQITISPKSKIPKSEGDMIRKRIKRIVEQMPFVYYDNEEITSTEKMILERIAKFENLEERIGKAKVQMKEDLNRLKRID